MLHFDTDEPRNVFVYAMIDDYLKTCNHATATGASVNGEPCKLTDAEVLVVFIIGCLDYAATASKARVL